MRLIRPARARLALLLLAAPLVPLLPLSPAAATAGPDCSTVSEQGTSGQTRVPLDFSGSPLGQMQVPEATAALAARGVTPGTGVDVAIIDSGVSPFAAPQRAGLTDLTGAPRNSPLAYYLGTVMASIVATPPYPGADGGPIGIAPGARITDVRAYQSPTAQEGTGVVTPTADTIAAGLEWALANRALVDIAVVGAPTAGSVRLQTVVQRLEAKGVIIVAATGVPTETAGSSTDASSAPQVAASYPADYPGVIAVGTPVGSDSSVTYPADPDTTIAGASAGLMSLGLDGQPCVVSAPSTAVAAASVAGVLALVRSAFPQDPPSRIVQRVVDAADGRPDVRSPYLGAGLVRAETALTRPLGAGGSDVASGSESRATPLTPPQPRGDALRETRHAAVWWGLLGGAALVVAVVVRPVLARRRISAPRR